MTAGKGTRRRAKGIRAPCSSPIDKSDITVATHFIPVPGEKRKRCYLLELPRELRREIWSYALARTDDPFRARGQPRSSCIVPFSQLTPKLWSVWSNLTNRAVKAHRYHVYGSLRHSCKEGCDSRVIRTERIYLGMALLHSKIFTDIMDENLLYKDNWFYFENKFSKWENHGSSGISYDFCTDIFHSHFFSQKMSVMTKVCINLTVEDVNGPCVPDINHLALFWINMPSLEHLIIEFQFVAELCERLVCTWQGRDGQQHHAPGISPRIQPGVFNWIWFHLNVQFGQVEAQTLRLKSFRWNLKNVGEFSVINLNEWDIETLRATLVPMVRRTCNFYGEFVFQILKQRVRYVRELRAHEEFLQRMVVHERYLPEPSWGKENSQ